MHCRPERLDQCLVDRRRDAAHRAEEPGLAQPMPEEPAGVSRSSIRMNHGSWLGTTAPASHLECVDGDLRGDPIRDRPSHDPSAERVDDGGAVDPSVSRTMLRDFAKLEPVRRVCAELPLHEILVGGGVRLPTRRFRRWERLADPEVTSGLRDGLPCATRSRARHRNSGGWAAGISRTPSETIIASTQGSRQAGQAPGSLDRAVWYPRFGLKRRDRLPCFVLTSQIGDLVVGECSPADDDVVATEEVQECCLGDAELIGKHLRGFPCFVSADDLLASLLAKPLSNPVRLWGR